MMPDSPDIKLVFLVEHTLEGTGLYWAPVRISPNGVLKYSKEKVQMPWFLFQ
jgi:hypothetical protein